MLKVDIFCPFVVDEVNGIWDSSDDFAVAPVVAVLVVGYVLLEHCLETLLHLEN